MISTFGKAKKNRGKPRNINIHHMPIPLIVQDTIEHADIILEVLDARFISKTRNQEIEKTIKKEGKLIIYVFNKSDLVDVNKIKRNIELEHLSPHLFFSSKVRKHSSNLRNLLKRESKKINKESINIGVIGYPNTGKSSLIKSLAMKSKIRISSESGYTKGAQKIKISDGLYLIDTPGIIPPEEKKSAMEEKLSQIGAIDWDKTKNPELAIHGLMRENPGVLEKNYKIEAEGDSEILIEELGKKLRFFRKKNLVDEIRTAKKILRDWQEGKINPRI